jgi:hypothetical protein
MPVTIPVKGMKLRHYRYAEQTKLFALYRDDDIYTNPSLLNANIIPTVSNN